jgi:hypothetical protein
MGASPIQSFASSPTRRASQAFYVSIFAALLAVNALVLTLAMWGSKAGSNLGMPQLKIATEVLRRIEKDEPKRERWSVKGKGPVCTPAALRRKCGPGDGAFDCLPAVRDGKPPPRWAIATYLQNDDYLAGALTLAYTLRKHGNRLPLIMYTLEGHDQLCPAGQQLAECAGWQLRKWKAIAPFKTLVEKRWFYQCAPTVLAP